MSEHTNGPWLQGGPTGHAADHVFGPDGQNAVAQVYGIPKHTTVEEASLAGDQWREGLANARLIAAAPELLETLRAIVAECETHSASELARTIAANARFAIAKATGQ